MCYLGEIFNHNFNLTEVEILNFTDANIQINATTFSLYYLNTQSKLTYIDES